MSEHRKSVPGSTYFLFSLNQTKYFEPNPNPVVSVLVFGCIFVYVFVCSMSDDGVCMCGLCVCGGVCVYVLALLILSDSGLPVFVGSLFKRMGFELFTFPVWNGIFPHTWLFVPKLNSLWALDSTGGYFKILKNLFYIELTIGKIKRKLTIQFNLLEVCKEEKCSQRLGAESSQKTGW